MTNTQSTTASIERNLDRMAIRKLPTHLVNKIAAGEVIERPASVLKELLENALDSGASRIDIAVEDGGKKLIQVTDNGCGMTRDDVALAFAPHATSKITTEDDLFRIQTLGFRGEALASVGSISHAHIRTRQGGEEGGWEVSAEGGRSGAPSPCSAPAGTTVTVRDLFFNTPARRKFLRTTNTEFGHITEQLIRVAMPHPQVAFTLRNNSRETLNPQATDSTTSRVAELFTPDLADCLLPLAARKQTIGVNGLLAPPAAARASGRWQYFFLNGRYIRDRLLGHALREAFRGLLGAGRYPVAMLFIEVDPADVDVNVHPTKIEVRFRESNMVYGEVLAALRETLNKSDLSPAAVGTDLQSPPTGLSDLTKSGPAETRGLGGKGGSEREASLREALADFFKSAPPQQPRLSFPEGRSYTPAAPPADGRHAREAEDKPTTPRQMLPPPPGRALPLMQIHNTYIVAQVEDGLIIVDQHALHERVLYNDFKRRLLDGPLTGQKMLIPQTIEVTAGEAVLLEGASDLLGRLGIELTPFGPNSFAIQQYPTVLADRSVAMDAFLRELLDRLAEEERTDEERMIEEMLSMMACKAAVKAGNPLSEAEMQDLLNAAEHAEKRASCPHGRPTTLRMTLKDLEKQFHRT